MISLFSTPFWGYFLTVHCQVRHRRFSHKKYMVELEFTITRRTHKFQASPIDLWTPTPFTPSSSANYFFLFCGLLSVTDPGVELGRGGGQPVYGLHP